MSTNWNNWTADRSFSDGDQENLSDAKMLECQPKIPEIDRALLLNFHTLGMNSDFPIG